MTLDARGTYSYLGGMDTSNETAEAAGSAHEISRAVVDAWIESGKPQTIRDIAEQTGRSESWVRKHIDRIDSYDFDVTAVRVPTYGKNYGDIVGYRSVTAYEPSKGRLRAMICAARES